MWLDRSRYNEDDGANTRPIISLPITRPLHSDAELGTAALPHWHPRAGLENLGALGEHSKWGSKIL